MITSPALIETSDNGMVPGAVFVFQHLAQRFTLDFSREQALRTMRQSREAAGTPAAEWWQWLPESANGLGFRCRIADLDAKEIRSLAQQGVPLLTYSAESNSWRAILDPRGRRVLAMCSGEIAGPRWIRAQEICRFINPTDHPQIRCAVLQPVSRCALAVSPPHTTLRPFARLRALLKPEASDVGILVVFALLVGLLALATPIAVEALVSTVTFGHLLQPIVVLSIVLLAFLSFSAAIRVLQTYVVEILQCRLFARVAADVAYRLPRINVAAQKKSLPELVNYFLDVVTVQKVTAMLLLDGLSIILSMLVGMIVLAFYHPWLLGFDIGLVMLLAFAVFVLGRGAVRTSIQESQEKFRTAAWLESLARCPLTFKQTGGAEFALQRLDHLAHDYLIARKQHFSVLLRQIVFALSMQALASAVLLGIGGWLVMVGQLTLGQLVAAELIVAVIVGSFARLGKYLESFYDLLAAIDKLGVLFDLPLEDPQGIAHQFPAGAAELRVHDLGHSGLHFEDFHIRPGEKVALQGRHSTTLLDLVYGLREPTSGHLLIDSFQPRELRMRCLRERVVLVRDVEVFPGTIAENIHLGRTQLTNNDVRKALQKVSLLDAVLRLPDGMQTTLDSQGSPLNEDQLCRLAIARAIVGHPGLLLIDRALDRLDDQAAESLLEMLCDSRQPWTLLFVSNREQLRSACARLLDLDPTPPASELESDEVLHG